MLDEIFKQIKVSLILLAILSILTGLIYPVMVTGIAQLFFSEKSNGSLIQQNDKIVGSKLIGQSFSSVAYFWGRPSATPYFPYNAEQSSGSNMGPLNPNFLTLVKSRVENMRENNPDASDVIPIELVTASASGLDPEISPEAAYYQAPRVAKARGLQIEKVQQIIADATRGRTLGMLGESRVNVLQLNLALDHLIQG